jgi:GTP pyrophosphokinase
MYGFDLVLKAERFCEEKHKGQKRKVSGQDYAVHPMGVAYLIASFKKSSNLHILLSAGRLHDTVEDCDVTYDEILKEFGMPVAVLVFELTDDKELIKVIGKLEYQKKKWSGLSNYAFYIKLCDRLYNISDHPTDKVIKDTEEILDYLETVRIFTKSQQAVVNEIRKIITKRKTK